MSNVLSKGWIWIKSSAFARSETWVATALAGSLSFAINFLMGPIYSGYVAKQFSIVQEKRDADRRAINRFKSDADAFQTFASAFVIGLTQDNKVERQALERLVANLQSQTISLDNAAKRLPSAIQPLVSQYKDALLSMNLALGRVHDVSTMKEFWERASDLLVIRQKLFRALDTVIA